jgi:hypothetical protein
LFAGIVATRAAFAGQTLWSSYSGIAGVATAVTWGILLFRFGPEIFPGGRGAPLARRIMAIVVLIYGLHMDWVDVRGLNPPGRTALLTRRGTVWVQDGIAPFYELLQRDLRSGERVLVLPEANALEPLFGIRAASAFPVLLPGWLDSRAEQRILSESKRGPPDAVVLFRRSTVELGVAPLGEGYGKDLVRWILETYQVEGASANGLLLRPKRPIAGPPQSGSIRK